DRRAKLREMLHADGYECLLLEGGDELLRVCAEFEPDLLLVAVRQPDGSGFELCGEVRASDPSRHIPVILIADDSDELAVAAGLFAGADDVILDVERTHELRARIHVQLRNKRLFDALRRVRSERDLLRRDAQTDPLTSLLNRRSLETAVSERCAARERFGVLFMDIDHFKLINDRFGHDMGDRVLVAVAHILKAGLRPGDIVARYGGEEFVALIAGAGPESARLVAERLRRHVEEMEPLPRGPEKVTISIGTTVFDPQKQDEAHVDLLRRADVALYAAKRAGRNRVVLAPTGKSADLEDEVAPNTTVSRTPAEGTRMAPNTARSG
ncbi:MAG TPA: diguanylate cyclase, partial [Polyangiaceae bacterium]|nr:diguanylate cyclase [Polyangiaceae bacterium]